MNHLKYPSSAPFLPALFISCLLAMACNKSNIKPPTQEEAALLNKKCIEMVIANDEILGKERNHACEKISLSKTVKAYSKGLKKLDYGNCSEEFTQAFERHRQAWLGVLPITDKYPELRGEMHDLFAQIEKGKDGEEFKNLVKAIWDTWGEVEAQIQ